MQKRSNSFFLFLILICFFIFLNACNSEDIQVSPIIEEDNRRDTVITVPPIFVSDCISQSEIPTDFFIKDEMPGVQAAGCSGTIYPNWKNPRFVLPFPVGTGYSIGLNNCSSLEHAKGKQDEYAIDFDMPIGSCIVAARAGTVTFIEESGEEGRTPDNIIVIEHKNSTFAAYQHLSKNGVLVKIGDKVKEGDFIGFSGNSGSAGYPHLHFVVGKKPFRPGFKSLPVTFKNTYPNLRGLASDKKYYAFPYEPFSFESDCENENAIPDDFLLEDKTPEIQAEGCPDVTYPDWETSPYVLPYPVSSRHRIDLNNCSSSFHNTGGTDQFATDFNMTTGSCITASRAGTVIHVEESGIDGGFPNNLIIIDHGDSTFAQYMHLTKDGAIVKVGNEVEQGDFIGYSGFTGFAGYPHLHFIVTKNGWEYPYEGIPITFKNTFSNLRGLASGKYYYAFSY